MGATCSPPVQWTVMSAKVELWSSSTSDRLYSSRTASRPMTTSMGTARRGDRGAEGAAPAGGGRRVQLVGGDPDQELGDDAAQEVLGADPAGVVGGLLGQAGSEQAGDLLVGPVLEDPGEEEVSLLQDGLDLVGIGVGRRQEAGRLELQQGGRDHQELGRDLPVELTPD